MCRRRNTWASLADVTSGWIMIKGVARQRLVLLNELEQGEEVRCSLLSNSACSIGIFGNYVFC